MGNSLTARVTELVNPTSRSVLLYECEENDPNGRLYTPIEVKPYRTKEIRASRFLLNHEHGGGPRTIRVKRIDSDDFENESYSAQYFLIHHRIIFRGEEGPLEVEAVKDPDTGGIFTDFRRTKLVRYFWRSEAPQIPAANHPQIPAPQSDRSDSSRALIPS